MGEKIPVKKSNHALARFSQRGISDQSVLILQRYTPARIHYGRVVYLGQDKYIDPLVRQALINAQEADKLRGLAVICTCEGEVVTAYYPDRKRWKIFMRCPFYRSSYQAETQAS